MNKPQEPNPDEAPLRRFARDYLRSRLAVAGLILLLLVLLLALAAPWVAPQNPYDLSKLDLMDSRLPPGSAALAGGHFVLGSDGMGRDMWSAILYGLRVSLTVGVCSGVIALCLGAGLGVSAAFFGGRFEQILMRLVDIQLGFPAKQISIQ